MAEHQEFPIDAFVDVYEDRVRVRLAGQPIFEIKRREIPDPKPTRPAEWADSALNEFGKRLRAVLSEDA